MNQNENRGNGMKALFSASQAEGRGFETPFPLKIQFRIQVFYYFRSWKYFWNRMIYSLL